MSANYWDSSQHLYWEDPTFESPSDLERGNLREEDRGLILKYPLPEPRLLNIFLQQQLSKLGKRLNVRQIVLATAFVYVRRFYLNVEIRRTNVYLIVATAFYLACKIEECPQHIKVVVAEARTLWPEVIQPDIAKLGECEFWLISEIKAQLIIHHPYRPLAVLQARLEMSQDEYGVAWSVVNDHYVTDLPMRYPPHVIAAVAVVMTLMLKPSPGKPGPPFPSGAAAMRLAAGAPNQASLTLAIQSKGEKLKAWLSQSKIELEVLIDATQHIISLYVLWERYNERECKEQVLKFIKDPTVAIARP